MPHPFGALMLHLIVTHSRKPGIVGSIPGFSSLSGETFKETRGPTTISEGKLQTRTYWEETGDYVVPNVISSRELIFRPDLSDFNWTIITTSRAFDLTFRFTYMYICSAQSRNGYNSGIVPAQSRNSHFAGQSKNSYLARFNSGIVPAQSRNRDKVRIYYFPAQSKTVYRKRYGYSSPKSGLDRSNLLPLGCTHVCIFFMTTSYLITIQCET